jgi:hypothetical protein
LKKPSAESLGDAGAAAALVVLVAILFAPALFAGRVFYQRDVVTMWYARVESMVRAVAEGAWPLWDPYSAFGAPALADPSYQLLYPSMWLNLVMSPPTYYVLHVAAHCVLAGLGLYLLCRSWGLGLLPSLASGMLWTASGPLLSTANVWHHFTGAVWMPWVLLALEGALASGSLGRALLLGVVGALQVLAGSGDLCLMTGLAALGRMLLFVARGPLPRREALGRVVRAGLVGGGFALALSAVLWMPAAALARDSTRPYMTAAARMYWSLHPALLLDFLVPGLVTRLPLSVPARAALYDAREPFLFWLYLGAASAPLVALGAALGRRPWRGFAVGGFGFFLLCALGRHGLVYRALAVLPPFTLMRYPVKYTVPMALFWAALAGLGVEACHGTWSGAEQRRARGLVALAVLGAMALAAAGVWLGAHPDALAPVVTAGADGLAADVRPAVHRLWMAAAFLAVEAALLVGRSARPQAPPWLAIAVVAIAIADVAWVGRQVNDLAPPELVAWRPPTLPAVEAARAGGRVEVVPPLVTRKSQLVRGPKGWEEEWLWARGIEDLLLPPSGARWGVPGSYDGDFTGLARPEQSKLTAWLQQTWGSFFALRLLQMGNVGAVVSLDEGRWSGKPVAEVPSVYAEPVRVFRVPDPLPAAYVVGRARRVREDAAEWVLGNAGFDLWREVIVISDSSAAPPGGPVPDFEGLVRLVERRADRLAFETEASAPGYLVVVEAYDPGWRATVDGDSAEVLRANFLFRAVAVPAGRHRVELRYRPRGLVWGGLVSALAVAVGLGYWELRGRRAPPAPAVTLIADPPGASIAAGPTVSGVRR